MGTEVDGFLFYITGNLPPVPNSPTCAISPRLPWLQKEETDIDANLLSTQTERPGINETRQPIVMDRLVKGI